MILLILFAITQVPVATATCNCPTKTIENGTIRGEIKTPNYPAPYCSNLICKWIIKHSDPWMAVGLKFLDVDTERNKDIIEIYQVEGKEKVLIETLSGKRGLALDLVSTAGGGFEINFISDGHTELLGFLAHFYRFTGVSWSGLTPRELQHECSQIVDMPTIFASDSCYVMGPKGSYAPSPDPSRKKDIKNNIGSNYSEAFYACDNFSNGHLALLNTRVLIRDVFTHFEKNMTGEIDIWVGLNQTYRAEPEIDAGVGWVWQLPNGRSWPALYEDTMWDTLDIMNDSPEPDNFDDLQHCGGLFRSLGLFDLRCSRFHQYICEYESRTSCPSPLVHDVMGNASGVIDISNNISGSMSCHYLIRADPTNCIQLKLTHLRLGKDDNVKIYDGEVLITTWSARSPSVLEDGTSVKSTGNKLKIVISSYETQLKFQATYQTFPNNCQCPDKTIELEAGQSGYLALPGYPNNYCNNMNCTWKLKTPGKDHAIQFEITFDTEPDKDYIKIKQDQGIPIVYSGLHEHSIIPLNFTVNHETEVIFHSNQENVGRGFLINYKVVKTDCLCPSIQQQTNTQGKITFNHIGQCETFDCIFHLHVPVEHSDKNVQLKVNISKAVLQGSFLRVYDQIIEPNSKSKPMKNIEPCINKSFIWKTYDGFTLHYHSESQFPYDIQGFSFSYRWLIDCSCDKPRELIAKPKAQTLLSPSFSSSYCPDLHCIWRIKSLHFQKVVLKLLKFETEENHDILHVFDGWTDQKARLLQTLSGDYSNKIVKSSGNYLELQFDTDETIELSGFEIEFYSELITESLKSSKNNVGYLVFIGFLIVLLLFLIFLLGFFLVTAITLHKHGSVHFGNSSAVILEFVSEKKVTLPPTGEEANETEKLNSDD